MTSYQIKKYSFNQAKKLNVKIYPSTNPSKKIDIYKDDIFITSIGSISYSDYPTYLELNKKYADERRRLYHLRHKKDNIIGTKGWYALNILW